MAAAGGASDFVAPGEDPSYDYTGEMERYPAEWDADVVLSDGRICIVRPTGPRDGDLLREFFGSLSERTLRLRYFTANRDLAEREAAKFLAADQRNHVALVVIQRGIAIGVASYDVVGRANAEIAFTIRDGVQGKGLGSILLEQLAAIARENGIHRFCADVLSDNKAMLGVFSGAGYRPTEELSEGVTRIDFSVDPTPTTRRIVWEREHAADVASITRLLAPDGIAVIAEQFGDGSVGMSLVEAIQGAGYRGSVALVSPDGSGCRGLRGQTSLAESQMGAELALIAVPVEGVDAAVDDCSSAGVRGIMLIRCQCNAADDPAWQRALVHRVRGEGMRLVGPRALGLINTDPRVMLNASAISRAPERGRVGLFSESAAYGMALLREVDRRRLGVSVCAGVGNATDVTISELLQYWADDDGTSVIAAHLETITNPRKFMRVARSAAQRKPVVVLRAGRGSRVLQFAVSGRRTELPPTAIEQIFAAAGILQVDTLSDLADTAALMALQPIPAGDRVAVISDSHALGRLAVDAAAALGLRPVNDPVGFDGSGADVLSAMIDARLEDPAVDMLLVAHGADPAVDDNRLREAITSSARRSAKPVVAVILSGDATPLAIGQGPHGLPAQGSVPVFRDVEAALRALGLAVEYGKWLRTPPSEAPEFPEIERERARAVVAGRLRRGTAGDSSGWLNAAEAGELLDSYGIDLWPAIPVHSEEQAVMAAHSLGFPVVLKSLKSKYRNPVESGAVRLNLENERSVRTAFLSMTATLDADSRTALVVQRMAPPGVACALDALEDPVFGPVLRFRLGGAATRTTGDFGFVVPVVGTREAARLISLPAAAPLLLDATGGDASGSPTLDLDALMDVIMRVGTLGDDLPEVAQLMLKPVLVHARGVAVLGAAARVERPVSRTGLEARRL